jgi:hypothetical protein
MTAAHLADFDVAFCDWLIGHVYDQWFVDRKLSCYARVDVASMWPLDNAHIRIDGPLPSAFRFDKDPFLNPSS